MVNISVRIDEELKNEMEKLDEVNWSQVLRSAIRKRLTQEKEKNLAKAVLLNEKIRKIAPEGFDSTEIIRKWRDSGSKNI
ncbi:MAG: hypothetical protein ACTSW1_09390 [Candidatus Hodarchaeales archaeon]